MNAEPLRDDATPSVDTIRQWTKVKTVAALIVVCGILLGMAGTLIAMNKAFKATAEGVQPVPVDSLFTSIGSSLQFGMWLTPVVICSLVLWLVARARLKTLNRSLAFSPRNAR